MKTLRCSNILFIFMIASELSSCQRKIMYAPGYDFELFKKTPAYYLAKAVENEDTVAITKYVIKDSVPVDYQEPRFGNSLLTLAVVNNKNLSATKLLDLGANPNLRSFDNGSPLLMACLNSNDLIKPQETIQMLINHGADVNSDQHDTTYDQFGKRKNYKTTALMISCIYGNLECVKTLVQNGVDLNLYPPNNDSSIVSIAALGGYNLDIVKYFLIEKKLPIPDYCVIRQLGNKHERKMTITDLLNEHSYTNNPKNQKLKKEILDYLSVNGKK